MTDGGLTSHEISARAIYAGVPPRAHAVTAVDRFSRRAAFIATGSQVPFGRFPDR